MSLIQVAKLDMRSIMTTYIRVLRRKTIESSSTSSSSALVIEERKSVSRREKSRGKSKLRKSLRCFYCNILYHIKNDCLKFKKDKDKYNNDRDDYTANVT